MACNFRDLEDQLLNTPEVETVTDTAAAVAPEAGQHLDGAQDLVEVVEGLSHAHEDDVGRRLGCRRLQPGEEVLRDHLLRA